MKRICEFKGKREIERSEWKRSTIIATSLVNSCRDYCNSLYHSHPVTQLKRLEQIQNEILMDGCGRRKWKTGSCEKDLRLIAKEFQRQGEELQKERSENFSLEVKGVRDRGGQRSEFYQ